MYRDNVNVFIVHKFVVPFIMVCDTKRKKKLKYCKILNYLSLYQNASKCLLIDQKVICIGRSFGNLYDPRDSEPDPTLY